MRFYRVLRPGLYNAVLCLMGSYGDYRGYAVSCFTRLHEASWGLFGSRERIVVEAPVQSKYSSAGVKVSTSGVHGCARNLSPYSL